MINQDDEKSFAVILGIPQDRQQNSLTVPATESRLGGVPAWHDGRFERDILSSIRCGHCGRTDKMLFLGQVFAPTDEDDRSLYIFACNTRACTLVSDGWIVFRNQSLAPDESDDEEDDEAKEITNTEATLAKSSVWDYSDKTPKNDSYVEEGDDEEDEEEDLSELMNMLSTRDASLSNAVSKPSKAAKKPSESSSVTPKVDRSDAVFREHIKETLPCYLIDDQDDPYTDKILDAGEDDDGEDDEDDDEPDYIGDADHIAQLLSSYMSAEEDVSVVELLKNLQEEQKAKAKSSEGKSKSKSVTKDVSTVHRKVESTATSSSQGDELDDEAFDKKLTREDPSSKTELIFQKIVSYEPKQVLRYAYYGLPLWCTLPAPIVSHIPSCELCGKSRIFELQLMPALLSIWSKSSVTTAMQPVKSIASSAATGISEDNTEESSDKLSSLPSEEAPIQRPTESQLSSFISSLDDGIDFGAVAIYCCPDGCRIRNKKAITPSGCYIDDEGVTWRECVVVQHPADIA